MKDLPPCLTNSQIQLPGSLRMPLSWAQEKNIVSTSELEKLGQFQITDMQDRLPSEISEELQEHISAERVNQTDQYQDATLTSAFLPFTSIDEAEGDKTGVDTVPLTLAPHSWPQSATTGSRFYIGDIYPCIEGGRYPVKRIAGEVIEVWTDVLRDGHDSLSVELVWRKEIEQEWRHVPMRMHSDDRWCAEFTPTDPGRYLFAIQAWTDQFSTWKHDVKLKLECGQDVSLDVKEAIEFLGNLKTCGTFARRVIEWVKRKRFSLSVEELLSEELALAVKMSDGREDLACSPLIPLEVDRPKARFASWYEMVPRSQSTVQGQHGTFDDCIKRIPELASLGFDVLYFPPIHPIGTTHRKGKNNSLKAELGDPGSMYAIGNSEGGHTAVHPELGTLDDFRRVVDVARTHGMEVALDFAAHCSPDHPWITEHPGWFKRRLDGSIKFAENPPKKYEDIVALDFYCEDRVALWKELLNVVLFWVEQGVQIFRVDNPHTKPFPLWEWLIRETQRRQPNVLFLSEAFTRPKIMKTLAKVGFTQSYTNFTWLTHKTELQAYLSDITCYPTQDYFRPNFFVSTPDILPFHLQSGEPWMFKSRLALAATLSSTYGIYNGFELLEHESIPGREEYLNSEKYEIKVRDWDKPGNIKQYIARLNQIRRENTALHQTNDLRFAQVDDDQIIGFVKESTTQDNAIAVAIALSGQSSRSFWFHFEGITIGRRDNRQAIHSIVNLVSGQRYVVEWGGVRLSINPTDDPALLFRCES